MSLTTFPLFRELLKELQVHNRKLAFVPNHTAPLHESDLFSVYADGDVPYVAPFYPSFLQELGRMIRFERRVYWATWLMMKNTCHLSRQLALKQFVDFVRSIKLEGYRFPSAGKNGEAVKRAVLREIEGTIEREKESGY